MSSDATLEFLQGTNGNAAEVDYSGLVMSKDFNSYLDAIDGGQIGSVDELRARIQAGRSGPNGNFVAVNGRYLTGSDQKPLIETRRVGDEQQSVLEEELATSISADRAKQNLSDFENLLQAALNGGAGSIEELRARFRAMLGGPSAPIIIGNKPLIGPGGRLVQETRKIDERQQQTILNIAEAIEENKRCEKSLAATQSYLEDVDRGVFDSEAVLSARLLAGRTDTGYVYVNGRLVSLGNQPLVERRRVNDAQANVILSEFKFLKNVDSISKNADGFLRFYRDILAGELTANNIDGPLDVALGKILGSRGVDSRFTDVSVTSEQADTLKLLAKTMTELDEETIQGLEEIIDNNTAEEVRRLCEERKARVRSKGEFASELRIAGVIDTVAGAARRASLEQAVCEDISAVQDETDVDTINANLLEYEEFSDADQLMVSRLRLALALKLQSIQTRQALSQAVSGDVAGAISFILSSCEPANDDRYVDLLKVLYAKELSEFRVDGYSLFTSDDLRRDELYEFCERIPVRRRAGDFDYVERANEIENGLRDDGTLLCLQRALLDVLPTFEFATPSELQDDLDRTFDRPDDEEIRQAIAMRYKKYISARRDSRRDDYDESFSADLEAIRQSLSPDYEFDQGFGRNLEASRYISERFKEVIVPIAQSLRGEFGADSFEAFIRNGSSKERGRLAFIIKIAELEKQRKLTEIERSYLESVELLSLYNPHLVGLANTNPAVLGVYLDNHFDQLSRQTFNDLVDGQYVPLVQIGLGPNGLVSAGELARSRPDIAAQTVFIDKAERIGGPFAIPRGPGWDLNSANSYGTEPTLPAVIPELEPVTVRAYGSPLRWYPGERIVSDEVREGSINVTVDYLLSPDSISDDRYPTNETEALVLQLQSALLLRKALLKTRVVDIIPDKKDPGLKLVKLERIGPDGKKAKLTIKTHNLINPTGLGEAYYGYPIEGTRSEKALRKSDRIVAQGGFPIFTDPLNGFRALSSREGPKPSLEGVLVIEGVGNSAETTIENVGRLFGRANPRTKGVTRIFVIGDKDLSKRPRYASVADLKPREGRGNLVEQVRARVSDVGFKDDNSRTNKLVLYGSDGRPIRNERGEVIVADSVFATTGFRSQLPKLLSKVAGVEEGQAFDDSLEEITLPTNPRLIVGDRLKRDRGVIVVGTASRTGFKGKGTSKFSQLPVDAREALLRNGSENAVAIGFRAPDTQAAVRLFLEERFGQRPTQDSSESLKRRLADLSLSRSVSNTVVEVIDSTNSRPRTIMPSDPALVPIRSDVINPSSVLSSLVSYEFRDARISQRGSSKMFDGQLEFCLEPRENGSYAFTSSAKGLNPWVGRLVQNPYFRSYARNAIERSRGATAVKVTLEVKSGRINARKSYVEAS